MSKLTDKQRAFAIKYAECNNACEAYRASYNAGSMSADVIKVKAHEVRHNGNVAVTILGLQEEARERALVTVESLSKLLSDNIVDAKRADQYGVVNTAVMGIAKLHGLDVTKVEHVNPLTIVMDKANDKL